MEHGSKASILSRPLALSPRAAYAGHLALGTTLFIVVIELWLWAVFGWDSLEEGTQFNLLCPMLVSGPVTALWALLGSAIHWRESRLRQLGAVLTLVLLLFVLVAVLEESGHFPSAIFPTLLVMGYILVVLEMSVPVAALWSRKVGLWTARICGTLLVAITVFDWIVSKTPFGFLR